MSKKNKWRNLDVTKAIIRVEVTLLDHVVPFYVYEPRPDPTGEYYTLNRQLGRFTFFPYTACHAELASRYYMEKVARHELTHAALYLTGNRAYAHGGGDHNAAVYSEEKIAALMEHVLPDVVTAAREVVEAIEQEVFLLDGCEFRDEWLDRPELNGVTTLMKDPQSAEAPSSGSEPPEPPTVQLALAPSDEPSSPLSMAGRLEHVFGGSCAFGPPPAQEPYAPGVVQFRLAGARLPADTEALAKVCYWRGWTYLWSAEEPPHLLAVYAHPGVREPRPHPPGAADGPARPGSC